MTTKRPYLFLDIDGVLNSFGGRDIWGDDKEYKLSPYGQTFVVTLSQRMADAINSLGCEIWWTTTWETEAPLVGNIIGIKAEGVLDLSLEPGWKHGAVMRKLNEDPRPFVWFEDEPGIYGTYNQKPRDGWPEHFIWNPSMLTGITPEVIDRARAFLSELSVDEPVI